MHRFLSTAALLVAAAFSPLAGAAQLGDPAGPLSIAEWVKGSSFKLEEVKGKKVVVVEFWATWCPPCLQSIPHLTELQKKYKDEVVFVGISDEPADTVKPFVEKMGDKMDYIVAVDNQLKTTEAYLGAFGVSGIPVAFVVDKKGDVVYQGHPLDPEFTMALGEVVAGTFDPKKITERKALQEKVAKDINTYFKLALEGATLEQLKELSEPLLTALQEDEEALYFIGFNLTNDESLKTRDLDFAHKALVRANELLEGKHPVALSALAQNLFAQGKVEEAIATQTKAVENAAEEDKADLEAQLKTFQAATKEAAGT